MRLTISKSRSNESIVVFVTQFPTRLPFHLTLSFVVNIFHSLVYPIPYMPVRYYHVAIALSFKETCSNYLFASPRETVYEAEIISVKYPLSVKSKKDNAQ